MKQRTGHIDLYIFISVLALMLFSIGVVYSASNYKASYMYKGDTDYFFRNHAIRVVVGVGALFAGMFIDYHHYKRWSKLILIAGLIVLALALVGGSAIKGAHRWLRLGPLSFQPSEFVKYALVIHLSVLLSMKQKYIQDFKYGYAPLMLWVLAVTGLIFLQPNMSNGALILSIGLLMMFIGRVNVKHIVATVAAGIPLLFIYALSAPYRLYRLQAYLMNDSATGLSNSRYQIEQAMIALGNGGVLGLGMGMSKQKELFLPESYGDFIFAIVGEEYGFVGTLVILVIFGLVLIRGVKIAKRAIDDLGRFLAIGITMTVVVYALVNASVTCGLAPTTGLPMPFLSYGGTAILFTAYALGILLNISMFTRLRPRENLVLTPESTPPTSQLYQ